jgi:hypothetical protein
MPRFDGTGPTGQGPLTGKGMGNCPGASSDSRKGMGFGRGFGRGFCRGFGWRNFFTKKEESEMLKDEKEALEEELKAIKERLSELEAK